MTSKEALHNLKAKIDYHITNEEEFNDALNELKTIEKDLEVLEILKKCNFDIDYEDGYNDKFILGTRHYVGITQEEFNKIKEWLKNEI